MCECMSVKWFNTYTYTERREVGSHHTFPLWQYDVMKHFAYTWTEQISPPSIILSLVLLSGFTFSIVPFRLFIVEEINYWLIFNSFFPCFLFFNQTLPPFHWRLVIIFLFHFQEEKIELCRHKNFGASSVIFNGLLHVLVAYIWNIVSKLRLASNLLIVHCLYSGPTCKENLPHFAFSFWEFVSWLKTLDWRFCISWTDCLLGLCLFVLDLWCIWLLTPSISVLSRYIYLPGQCYGRLNISKPGV